MLEKDFFHKRKFSKLILQLVVLRCPYKDAAYIKEREIRTTTPWPRPRNRFYFAWRDDEMILEKFGPMMDRGCTANKSPLQGQHARMDSMSSCLTTLS